MKKYVKRITALIVVLALTAGIVCTFASCNKDKKAKVTLSDVYVANDSYAEFTGCERVTVLPVGWQVYTDSSTTTTEEANANSDVGYIKSLDAFIIKTTDASNQTCLSVIKLNDEKVYFEGGAQGMLFPVTVGITAIRVKGNVMAVKYKNGDCAVYGENANLLLSRTKITGAKSVSIDKAVKLLDTELIAVNSAYDTQGTAGYTSIYRPTSDGELSERGKLVAYVKNPSGDISFFKGFDNRYISVIGNTDSAYMFVIPESASDPVAKLSTGNGVIEATSTKNDYYYEIVYIGGGRFYVYKDWTVGEGEDYTFTDGKEYYKCERFIYYADSDNLSVYKDNADKIFMNLSNSYDNSSSGIVAGIYLKPGYTYASYGLNLFKTEEGKKMGFYDQYILDSDLNIVMSLTGNYGEELTQDDRENITALDLLMNSTDGVYYVPYLPSVAKFYDKDGNQIGINEDYNILGLSVSDGIAVAQIQDPDDEDEYLYGLIDTKGNVVADFKYTSIASFRGFYTIAEKDNEGKTAVVILGRDGKEYPIMSDLSESLSDIATTSAGNYIYKIGAYMYRETKGGTTYYGIKTFNPNAQKNILMSANMVQGATLYSPVTSTKDVFVFEKITSTDSTVTYVIYRLK
ncbi:MAG: WG repeat-containing protein [Clostridia bacterium]|nr:WG repeat-containing protein [Clostridia bacterium]